MPPLPRPPPLPKAGQQQSPRPPKYALLLAGKFGRALMVAEVVTLVGTGVLYWKLTTNEEARSKLEQRMPWLMGVFHKVTQGKYKNIKGVDPEPR